MPDLIVKGGATANEKPVRVWADGCYDIGHFGHANNLRQAKNLGTTLIVGVHPDHEILKHKNCLPVFNEKERREMIGAMRWVDEVVADAPYICSLETLDKNGAAFSVHGNDVAVSENEVDVYQSVKDAGRYKEVNRTEGISTTGIIKRILRIGQKEENGSKISDSACSRYTGVKNPFLLTNAKINQFSPPLKVRKDSDRFVYVCGAFDIFHPGHIRFLKEAAAQGDYLIVGVHDDEAVKAYKGQYYPILNLTERFLSVLACKYVDEVIIGAPYTVSKELLDEFKVDIVAVGRQEIADDPKTGQDPYKIPKEQGKFKILNSGSDLKTEDIVARVLERRSEFEARNASKEKKENDIENEINGKGNNVVSEPVLVVKDENFQFLLDEATTTALDNAKIDNADTTDLNNNEEEHC